MRSTTIAIAASEEVPVTAPEDTSARDHELVTLAAAGDPDAFAELYRRHLDRVYAFAYRRCGSREVAEDVTAATFEKAYRNLGKFEPSGGGFPAWILRIAANQTNDHHRRASRPTSDRGQIAMQRLVTEAERPDESVLRSIDAEVLRLALDRLSPRYRTALSLRYLSDLTNEEAAASMGVSRGTMAVLVHRSLKSMRKQLVAMGEEVPS